MLVEHPAASEAGLSRGGPPGHWQVAVLAAVPLATLVGSNVALVKKVGHSVEDCPTVLKQEKQKRKQIGKQN